MTADIIEFPTIFLGGYVADSNGKMHYEIPLLAAESRGKIGRRIVICSFRLCDGTSHPARPVSDYMETTDAGECIDCARKSLDMNTREPPFMPPAPSSGFRKWRLLSRRELTRHLQEKEQNPKGNLNECN